MTESKTLGKIQLSSLPLLNTTLETALFEEIISLMLQKDKTELTSKQSKVLMTFIYDSEVLNGGHLQYLQNQGIEKISQIINFLETLGASCQREIPEKVFDYIQKVPVTRAKTIEKYQERAMKGEFLELDMVYYNCPSELGIEILPQYVNQHLSEFVEIE